MQSPQRGISGVSSLQFQGRLREIKQKKGSGEWNSEVLLNQGQDTPISACKEGAKEKGLRGKRGRAEEACNRLLMLYWVEGEIKDNGVLGGETVS